MLNSIFNIAQVPWAVPAGQERGDPAIHLEESLQPALQLLSQIDPVS